MTFLRPPMLDGDALHGVFSITTVATLPCQTGKHDTFLQVLHNSLRPLSHIIFCHSEATARFLQTVHSDLLVHLCSLDGGRMI